MNRVLKTVLVAAVAAGCGIASGTASAHWHGTVGVYVGPGPFWWGAPYPYYYPPYYAYPPVVVADPVYSQPSVRMPAPPSYWYFCPQSNAYYPYVSQCPGGWQQITPQVPQGPTASPEPDPAAR